MQIRIPVLDRRLAQLRSLVSCLLWVSNLPVMPRYTGPLYRASPTRQAFDQTFSLVSTRAQRRRQAADGPADNFPALPPSSTVGPLLSFPVLGRQQRGPLAVALAAAWAPSCHRTRRSTGVSHASSLVPRRASSASAISRSSLRRPRALLAPGVLSEVQIAIKRRFSRIRTSGSASESASESALNVARTRWTARSFSASASSADSNSLTNPLSQTAAEDRTPSPPTAPPPTRPVPQPPRRRARHRLAPTRPVPQPPRRRPARSRRPALSPTPPRCQPASPPTRPSPTPPVPIRSSRALAGPSGQGPTHRR